MNSCLVIPIELLFEIVIFVDSLEEILNIATLNRKWFKEILKFIRTKSFVELRESMTIDLNMFKNDNVDLDARNELYEIILGIKFPKIKLITIKSKEIKNEVLEYLFESCQNIEVLEIFSFSKILANHIRKLCSEIVRLKLISIYCGLCKCNYDTKEGKENYSCLCFTYKRKLIVRRPKINNADFDSTINGSILRYLDFYTQELE